MKLLGGERLWATTATLNLRILLRRDTGICFCFYIGLYTLRRFLYSKELSRRNLLICIRRLTILSPLMNFFLSPTVCGTRFFSG